MANLTEEVKKLVDDGILHIFDSEWICKLKPEDQLAAAMKCISGTRLEMYRKDTSDRSTISHGVKSYE